jgi:hypothetical protein
MYAVEVTSGGMIYISSFMTFSLAIQGHYLNNLLMGGIYYVRR